MECPSCGTPRQGRERVCRECGARFGGNGRLAVVVVLALLGLVVWYVVTSGDTVGGVEGSVDLPDPEDAQGTFSPPPPPPMVEEAVPCASADEEATLDCPTWSIETAQFASPFGTPLIVDGRILVGTRRGVVAIDAARGEIVWANHLGAAVEFPPAVGQSHLYVVDESRGVTALSRADGRRVWGVRLDQPPVAPPILVGTTVVVATEGLVVGLGVDGARLWAVAADGTPSQPVEAARQQVVVGDGGGSIRSIDAATGRIEWQETVNGWRVLVVDDETVVVSGWFGGPITALDSRTGGVVWTTPAAPGQLSMPHLGPGSLLYDAFDDGLLRIDAKTGEAEVLGSLPAPAPRSNPQVPGARPWLEIGPQGLLHLRNAEGGVTVLDTDGIEIWSSDWQSVHLVETGWNGHEPWMAVVSGGRSQMAALPAPRREFSPATTLEPGRACPATPLQERSYGQVAAGGVYEILEPGTAPLGTGETFLFDLDESERPLFVSGRRLDGSGVMGFRTSFADEPVAELELSTGQRSAPGFPPHWGIVVSVPSPGCWAYRIEGPLGVDHIVVEITEDFEQLPPGERRGPVLAPT